MKVVSQLSGKAKVRGIAKTESRLYLKSRELWVGLSIVLLALLGVLLAHWPAPVELLFTHGDLIAVPMTAFVVILVATMGLARETQESFSDIWNSLPIRNADQYWGKIWGTHTVIAVFVFAWLLVIPVVWYLSGMVWSASTTSMMVGYLAQVVAVLLLAIGIAALLQSAISNMWVRAAVGVGVLVAFSFVQRFGFDDATQWGVLLSPYIVGGVPYGHSSLFGMFPWERAVLWHVVFQMAVGLSLLGLGTVIYRRRRDPARNVVLSVGSVICLFALVAVSSVMYQRYWRDVDQILSKQMAYDTRAVSLASAGSGSLPGTSAGLSVPTVTAYDLTVESSGDNLHIVAALTLAGVQGDGRYPLTLHHQWEVSDVTGPSVAGWDREANVVWVELLDADAVADITVTYVGQPFLWNQWAGRISPMHFASERGGYLSPLLAWYPLPGERQLVDASDGYFRLPWEPLLTAPADFRVHWIGPQGLRVTSNLSAWEHETADGRQQVTFHGRSDGVSMFFGPIGEESAGEMQLLGALSVAREGSDLGEPYERLFAFYDALLGRSIPREPVVVVPDWLVDIYTEYQWSPLDSWGGFPLLRATSILGSSLVLSERDVVSAAEAAREWQHTQVSESLLDATESLHHGLLQAIWGRPHVHRAYLQNPVHKGLAEYTLLQWANHVAGDVDRDLDKSFSGRPRTSEERLTAQVLTSLLQLEQTHGMSAVQRLLGLAYDQLDTSELDWAGFQTLLQMVQGETSAI